MRQCCDASLGGCITLRLGLAHAVSRRRDVHNHTSIGEMRGEELGKVEWGGDSYAHGILELLIAAFVDTLHQRQGIVDKVVHMTILSDDLLGKPLQHLLVRYIANKVISSLLVDDTDMGTSLLKLIGNLIEGYSLELFFWCSALPIYHNRDSR